MDFEWDEKKRLANVGKHRIDFVDAAGIFEGPIVESTDTRHNYGEVRFQVLGIFQGVIMEVVYTWRGSNRRIISARRAKRDECEAYYEGIKSAAQKH